MRAWSPAMRSVVADASVAVLGSYRLGEPDVEGMEVLRVECERDHPDLDWDAPFFMAMSEGTLADVFDFVMEHEGRRHGGRR